MSKPFIKARCGLCSGFPLCCVLFFVLGWDPWLLRRSRLRKRYNGWMRQSEARHGHTFGYIPCPLHLWLGRKCKVRRCNPGCWCGMGDWRAGRKANKRREMEAQAKRLGPSWRYDVERHRITIK